MAIKNYLKSVKDITAPLNWKSSPDSPKTQLAYITNAEKDLLVKSNLHGSMKGKPNKGPMGIISLDGMGKEDTSKPEKKTRSDGGSYGRDYGVTIDVSTKEGQDKRQDFRDRTGSNVVTEDEIQGRKDLGRDAADTSAPSGGTDDKVIEQQAQRVKEFKTAKEKIEEKLAFRLFGKPIIEITDQNQLNYIKKLITNSVGNKPDANILEDFANALGFGDEGLYRADGEGIEVGSNADEFMTPGSLTTKGLDSQLKEEFGDNIYENLSLNNPQINFLAKGVRQTRGGIESFAQNKTVDTSTMDRNSEEYKQAKKYNNAIFAARETTNNYKEAYDARQAGNTGGSTAPPPDPDPVIPVDPIPTPGIPTPTPKYPGSVVNDYTNMGIPNIYGNQQIPTYGYANYNQTGQPVGLQNYLDNLRKRFGIG